MQLSTELVADRYTSFVAGLHDGAVFTEHGGRQAGVEVRLSLLGAFRLLGVPSSELAHCVVEIDALGSRPLAELADPDPGRRPAGTGLRAVEGRSA